MVTALSQYRGTVQNFFFFSVSFVCCISHFSEFFNVKANKHTLAQIFVLPSNKATVVDTAALPDLFIY